jgi:hypothetical protein
MQSYYMFAFPPPLWDTFAIIIPIDTTNKVTIKVTTYNLMRIQIHM